MKNNYNDGLDKIGHNVGYTPTLGHYFYPQHKINTWNSNLFIYPYSEYGLLKFSRNLNKLDYA